MTKETENQLDVARSELWRGVRHKLNSSNHSASPIMTTLTFAQSIDGSISSRLRRPLQLSNRYSQRFTHQLRAAHDGILVGIETVLSDDPKLNVRLAPGKSPRAVVVDSRLRIPQEAQLLNLPGARPLIAVGPEASPDKAKQLEANGASLVRCQLSASGRIDLVDLLPKLRTLGLRTLMVEGGARIITSFVQQELADQLVLTICPRFVGGQNALVPEESSGGVLFRGPGTLPLTNVQWHALAGDMILRADFDRSDNSLETLDSLLPSDRKAQRKDQARHGATRYHSMACVVNPVESIDD